MKKVIIITMLLFISIAVFSQNRIAGMVYDKETGETLIGATVIDKATQLGATTNLYGYFSLRVSENDTLLNLQVSFLGYEQQEIQIKKISTIQIYLRPKEFDIDEIVVHEFGAHTQSENHGLYKLLPKDLQQLPSFAGESDLLTFMQLVPGVAIAGDANATMNVRGGSNEQNLFLLDDLPLYYVNHLGGFLSSFNSDVIKSTDFYKSGFPALYGGRLSSIVDVRTNDGNLNRYNVYGTIGLLSSKIGLDGPIVKNKSSFLVSFRKNTIPIFKWLYDLNVDFSFYDANLKLNYILSPKDRIFFSFYNGNDEVGFLNKKDFNNKIDYNNGLESNTNVEGTNINKQSVLWGNIAGSLRYNRIISSKLYGSLVLGNTAYRYKELSYSKQNEYGDITITQNDFHSSISDNFLRINFEFYPLVKIVVTAGYKFTHHDYVPGKSAYSNSNENGDTVGRDFGYPEGTSNEHNLFFQVDLNDIYGFNVNGGFRQSLLFSNQNIYRLPEPRIKLSKHLGTKFLLSATYDVMYQNFHLLTNQGTGIPVEYRIPILAFAPPEKSNQYSLGLSYLLGSKGISLSVDIYSKQLNNLVSLKEGVSFTSSFKTWEEIIWGNGSGRSKGIEVLIRKAKGKTTGWIGATFAKSERRFDQLNNGNYFPYKYDRPFEFKSFIGHQLTKNIEASATWVYGSGTPISVPVGQYFDSEDQTILIYGDRNSVRGEAYHRLDIGLTLKMHPKWGESNWKFGILNLYNRKNPYYYFYDYNHIDGDGKMTLYKQTLFSFLPSISYSFKF